MSTLFSAAIRSAGILCLSSIPVLIHAAENDADTGIVSDEPLEIIITAGRKAQTIDETLAPVTVITRQDIERYQATEIADVLRRVPSINIANTGGTGKVTSVFMRGTSNKQLLVLVDGIKIGSATLGETSFHHIPLDQVERIEVVRGPRSSLYGSEAIGGVVQIFTHKGQKGFNPSVKIAAGSHNTQRISTNLSSGTDNSWFNINAGSEKTDGFDSCYSATTGCFTSTETDNDGYRRESIALNAGHRFNNGMKAELSAQHSKGHNEFDGSFQNQANFLQQAISTKLSGNITSNMNFVFTAGQSRDYSDNFKDNVYASTFNTRRNTLSLLSTIQTSPNGELTVGIDQQKDNVESSTAYDISSRKNDGIFANYTHRFNQTDLEVALRQDDNEQFGTYNTGSMAVGHELDNGLKIKASHGKSFRAPTFNELYFPGFGNTALTPENSRNTEVGLSKDWENGSWAVNAFHNEINDLIGGFPVSNTTGETRIRGFEGEVTTRVGQWGIAANLTLQRAENQASGKRLRYRPDQILNIDVDRRFGKVSAGGTLHAESKRYTDTTNTEANALPGYATVDLRAKYQLAKDWTIGAKVGNVLDKQYETSRGYNQDGINGLLTLEYAPK